MAKNINAVVSDLLSVQKQMRDLAKQEIELKAIIRDHMGKERFLKTPDAFVFIESRTRTDLSKELLIKEMGPEKLKKFMVESMYDCLFVRPLNVPKAKAK